MKMPQAWNAVTAKTATKVTAKIDMGAATVGKGLCPECRTPMETVTVKGQKMWTCAADRITLPMPNEDQHENPVP